MALTAEQIAKQAGVSVATVSRVLNNSGRVSDEARQAVLEAIRASGAMPRLRGKRTGRRLKERAGAGGVVEIVLVRSMPMEMLEVRSGEYDVGAVWTFRQKGSFFDGMRSRVRYGWVYDRESTGNQKATDFRIDINLPIKFL